MKNKLSLLIIIFIFNIFYISALCNEGQIDINTASLEELDNIIWVGNATAQKIIALRPFNSIDELDKVSGIGDIKLADIKSQGLACVDSEAEDNEENETETEEIVNNKTNIDNESSIKEAVEIKTSPKKTGLETIELNPKDIKSGDNFESLKGNYAIYGFIAFSILIVILFMLRKNRYKNEFR